MLPQKNQFYTFYDNKIHEKRAAYSNQDLKQV